MLRPRFTIRSVRGPRHRSVCRDTCRCACRSACYTPLSKLPFAEFSCEILKEDDKPSFLLVHAGVTYRGSCASHAEAQLGPGLDLASLPGVPLILDLVRTPTRCASQAEAVEFVTRVFDAKKATLLKTLGAPAWPNSASWQPVTAAEPAAYGSRRGPLGSRVEPQPRGLRTAAVGSRRGATKVANIPAFGHPPHRLWPCRRCSPRGPGLMPWTTAA